MKDRLTIRQKIISCLDIIFNRESSLTYIVHLEERCFNANFAPFSTKVIKDYDYFVWNEDTIHNAEEWLKEHH